MVRPPDLPLSKFMFPAEDLPKLRQEIALLESVDAMAGQHGMRVWEYAMALRALTEWRESAVCKQLPSMASDGPGSDQVYLQLAEVGGGGSNFVHALTRLHTMPVIIDPVIGESVEDYSRKPHAPEFFHAVTCISVIEHVPDLTPFFRAIHTILKPGGLLFLTTDAWGCDGPDTAHYHWMRKRIYNAGSLQRLGGKLRTMGFQSFGIGDWTYHGDHLFGSYTFASLALIKTPQEA